MLAYKQGRCQTILCARRAHAAQGMCGGMGVGTGYMEGGRVVRLTELGQLLLVPASGSGSSSGEAAVGEVLSMPAPSGAEQHVHMAAPGLPAAQHHGPPPY